MMYSNENEDVGLQLLEDQKRTRSGRIIPDYSELPSNSSEDDDTEQKREEPETESEENTMYDSASQDHVDCKRNPNKKAGQFKLSDEGRKEIELAYMAMRESDMWKLSSGRFVEKELFKLGKELKFEHAAHSFIIDVNDEVIKKHFSEIELQEIEEVPSPKVSDLSQDVIEYLNKFMNKNTAKDTRVVLNERDDKFDINYHSKTHHDIDYIKFAIYALIREIENGNIKQLNLEEWFNCHVWHSVFDQGFGDIKIFQLLGGESTSLATAIRKNRGRTATKRRKIGHRGDWILRKIGNGDRLEYGAGEAGKIGEDEFGTKTLKEMCLKLPKTLKDMLLQLINKVGWSDERRKLQTVGIVHAGLMMTVLYMDNPRGYICRVRRSEMLEIPDKEENLPKVLTILAAVLNIKIAVKETIKIIESKTQGTDTFKQAGKPKRSQNHNEVPVCSDVHWKIGSYWNLPILPIPSPPMPINFIGSFQCT